MMGPTQDAPAALTPQQVRQLATALVAYLVVNTSAQLLTTALPDIRSDIRATADEGSWIATMFTLGVVVGVVIATPLLRTLGLGRYVAACGAGYAALAVACTAGPPLPVFVLLRGVQGIAAGGLGPAAFVAVFTVAGRSWLMAGLALLAFVLLLPASLGPALAGPVEEAFGWEALFWIQALSGAAAAAAALANIPRTSLDLTALRADWMGIGSLGIGLGAFTLALSEGTRRFWLESDLILASFAASLGGWVAFILLVWLRPGAVMEPRLLANRRFSVPVTIHFLFRACLVLVTYVAPQFLVTLHGYRPIELSGLFAISALAQVLALPVVWWLLHRVDGRLLIAGGLGMLATGAMLLCRTTSQSAAEAFAGPLALVGFAQVLFLVPNLQAGGEVLTTSDGPTASILFNATSVGGATLGLGLASHLAVEREKYHSAVLVEHVPAFAGTTAQRLENLAAFLGARQPDDAAAAASATAILDQAVRGQAWTLAYGDLFVILSAVLVACAAAVLMLFDRLPPLVRGQRPSRPAGASL